MQAILAPLDDPQMPVETPPHAVVPFPFNFARFNAEFGKQNDAPDSQQYLVAEALQRLGQAGAEQIAKACGLSAYTVRKRLPELACAEKTDERRRTASGRLEFIWRFKA